MFYGNKSRGFFDLHSIIYSSIFATKDYKSLRDNGFTLIHAEQKSFALSKYKRGEKQITVIGRNILFNLMIEEYYEELFTQYSLNKEDSTVIIDYFKSLAKIVIEFYNK